MTELSDLNFRFADWWIASWFLQMQRAIKVVRSIFWQVILLAWSNIRSVEKWLQTISYYIGIVLTLNITIVPDISELRWIVIIVGIEEWSRNCLWCNMWLQTQSGFQFLTTRLTSRTRTIYIRYTAIGWTWW